MKRVDKDMCVRGEIICSRTFTFYRIICDAFMSKVRVMKPTLEEEYTCLAVNAASLALVDILDKLPSKKKKEILPRLIQRLETMRG